MKIALCLCLSLIEVTGPPATSDHEAFKRALFFGKDVFYLYTRSNSVPDEIRANNFNDLDESHFQPEKPSFILIAGTLHDNAIPISKNIRPALLQTKDANVFNFAYPSMLLLEVNPILKFGTIVANFVNYTCTNYGVPFSKFNFIGFGFGAYIAAHAGNLLEGRIATIVGLDPNNFLLVKYPLNFNSSTKVIVLHTSLSGVQTNVGNIDIYFNNGRYQPDCGITGAVRCAHFRAYEYCARAILDPGIIATICDNYENFVARACDNNQKVSVGSLVLEGTPPGTYYLNYTLQ